MISFAYELENETGYISIAFWWICMWRRISNFVMSSISVRIARIFVLLVFMACPAAVAPNHVAACKFDYRILSSGFSWVRGPLVCHNLPHRAFTILPSTCLLTFLSSIVCRACHITFYQTGLLQDAAVSAVATSHLKTKKKKKIKTKYENIKIQYLRYWDTETLGCSVFSASQLAEKVVFGGAAQIWPNGMQPRHLRWASSSWDCYGYGYGFWVRVWVSWPWSPFPWPWPSSSTCPQLLQCPQPPAPSAPLV